MPDASRVDPHHARRRIVQDRDADERGVHDVADLGHDDLEYAIDVEAREDGFVDFGERRQRGELMPEAGVHGVERDRELTEFVVAGHLDACSEILIGGATSAFDQLSQRHQRAADLRQAQQGREEKREDYRWKKDQLEVAERNKNV